MVPLNDDAPLARSFAALLAELRRDLTARWHPEAPEAGFAEWAARRAATSLDVHVSELDIQGLRPQRWSEAPALATIGFRLDQLNDADVRESWRSGVTKLMKRDAAPPDRNSFLFRPVEMLGLAAGAQALVADDDTAVRWLRKVIEQQGDTLTPTAPLAAILSGLAAHIVGAALAFHRIDADNLGDLAAAVWLQTVEPDLGGSIISLSRDELARTLLEATLVDNGEPTGLADGALRYLSLKLVVASGFGALTFTGAAPAERVAALCRRFPLLVDELNYRHDRRLFGVTDEYDVQDLLHGILRLHFDDVRVEEWNPSYGGVQSRSDLLLKAERVVIETKMTRKSLGQKELVHQLIVDKTQYRNHPDCGTLVCFVYDPERRLPNPAAIEADLSGEDDGLPTLVVIAPRGL